MSELRAACWLAVSGTICLAWPALALAAGGGPCAGASGPPIPVTLIHVASIHPSLAGFKWFRRSHVSVTLAPTQPRALAPGPSQKHRPGVLGVGAETAVVDCVAETSIQSHRLDRLVSMRRRAGSPLIFYQVRWVNGPMHGSMRSVICTASATLLLWLFGS